MIFNQLQPGAPLKKCIIVCGPTAIGKTDMAIRLAQHYDAEIISADSRQLYQELDIAVAKPNAEELAKVPHHLISHVSIHEHYNSGLYIDDALHHLQDIFQKKDTAIICGGSGLYIESLLHGLNALPTADQQLRAKLKLEYDTHGLAHIQHRLHILDPEYYSTIDTKNPARILRALEIIQLTQQKLSTQIEVKTDYQFPYPYRKIVLQMPRLELYTRINDRVEAMLDAGLEAEARMLYPYRNLKSLQTVGYSEWFEYFDGKISKSECIDKIKQHTRNYAKRQVTWFKKDTQAAHFDVHDFSKIITYIDQEFKL